MQQRLQSPHVFRHKSNIGILGEDIAESFLRSKRYDILSRNFHSRYGELDIVAQDGSTLVFVEVKTRIGDSYGLPQYAITKKKIHDITMCGQYYSLLHPALPKSLRIDVIAIRLDPESKQPRSIEHFSNITSSSVRY